MTKTEQFDPYYKWLGIPAKDQPPHHYRLLGIQVFEEDPDVVEAAANRHMAHLRTYQTGKHAKFSQQLLNEISAAKICLLNPDKQAEYDRKLKKELLKKKQRLEKRKATYQAPPLADPAPAATAPVAETAAPADIPTADVASAVAVAPRVVESPARIRSASRAPSASARARKKPNPTVPIAIIGGALALLLIAAAVVAVGMNAGMGQVAEDGGGETTDGRTDAADSAPDRDWRSINKERPRKENPPDKRPGGELPQNPKFGEPGNPVNPPKTGRRNEADATSKPVNVLPILDLEQDVLTGKWEPNADTPELTARGGKGFAVLQIPCQLAPSYEISATIERLSSGGAFYFGLVAGEQRVCAVLDEMNDSSFGEFASGLGDIDGQGVSKNGTVRDGRLLAQDVKKTVRCYVLPERIVVICGDDVVVDWKGKFEQLSFATPMEIVARDQLSMAADGADFRISDVTIEPIAEPADFRLPGDDSPVAKKRLPAPDGESIVRLRAELQPGYQKQLADEMAPSKRKVIINEIINVATADDVDPLRCFVLLLLAGELASGAGEAELAVAAADRRSALFVVDVLDDKVAWVQKSVESAVNSTMRKEAAGAARGVADLLVEATRLDEAIRLLKIAEQSANAGKDPVLAKRIGERISEVEELRRKAEDDSPP